VRSIGLLSDHAPDPRRPLRYRPVCGVFTTLGSHGQPQSTLVWVDLDRGCALVNTTLELTRKYTSPPAYYGYLYP
jgi:hypothetical protein